MNWTKLKEKIYYWDGSWRDIYVLQTNLEDNQKWADYVNKNYRIEWFNSLTQTSENTINIEAIQEYWSGNNDFFSTSKIFIDKIQINNHFFTELEIENDIDPRQINSIEDHERVIKYMTDLSKILGKSVVLTPENDQEVILIRVLGEKIDYLDNISPNE